MSTFVALPPASCLLPPASCLLPPAYCLLPTASCLLPPAYCLLPTRDNRDALFSQLPKEFRDMGMVGRFDGAEHVDGGHIRAGKCAVVRDLFDACARGRDSLSEPGESAGTVADRGREAAEPAVGDQPMLD